MADQTSPMPESRMQAVLVADVADGGTGGQGDRASVRRIAREVAAANGGRILYMSQDSVFALYENVLDAVGAALAVQAKLREPAQAGFSQLRIGVHVGQVLFQDGRTFGETLIIGSWLESLAEAGGVLVSAEVKDAVAPQLTATFEACGLQDFAQTRRRIATFRVRTAESFAAPAASLAPRLDETLLDQPPNVVPLPQDDDAGNVVNEATPSSAAALDATMNMTMLSQPPELNRAEPNDPQGSAGTGMPPAPKLDETLLDRPPNVAQRPPSPLPQDDNAGKAVSQAAPSSADALDATMKITMLGQPPELNRTGPNDRRGSAGTGMPPAPTLDETLLGQPPNVAQRSPSPIPPDDSAGKAVSATAPSSADAFDASMDETLLGQPPELNRAVPNDWPGGAATGGPKAAVPPDSVVVLTGAPAAAPRTAKPGEAIQTLPEDGVPAPLAPDGWHRPLTRVLAKRIGPIAPIIVNREAAAAATPAELIERLAETIPSLRERAEFRVEAARLLPR